MKTKHGRETVTNIDSGDRRIDALFPRIRSFMIQDVSEINVLGSRVRGYHSPDTPSLWIRDHSDMMRGARYWEEDMVSLVDYFAETQTRRGWLFDYVTLVPDKLPCERENWAKHVRVPVEADVEYRFINGVFLGWQATGDDTWMKRLLPHCEKALAYVLTDPWRWDKKRGLVKRAYTIDTWDFDYTAGKHDWLNFQITDDTFWGIMHGDSSGYYQAFQQMAVMYDHIKQRTRAAHWRRFAASFRKRANAASFNGQFYTHHVPLVPVRIEGVDENAQLSLSNPMDINRGLATHAMAVSILEEYRRRGESTGAFAPWFSIDPPFPDGIYGDEKLVGGAYCNGGIMPLVGGELARAAFEHGLEQFGVEQLLRYEELTRNNETYLWYFPNGKHATKETSTSPEAYPTDGWGASAMLYALMEGLAGIVDLGQQWERVRLSPRWLAAGLNESHVTCVYGATGVPVAYTYIHDPAARTITLEVEGQSGLDLHVLLPSGTRVRRMTCKGRTVRSTTSMICQSPYADAVCTVKGHAAIVIQYS
ncbi:MAG: hypothetical protein H6Q32_884 [Bacteroidetes bacterium]|nr:hypothetical protein [Bacteroidota bacterium]